MNEELIQKIRSAETPEELMQLAGENNYPLSLEAAQELFRTLHSSGELMDEELDSVAGGGCQTDVGGRSYTVVTCSLSCFTGHYAPAKVYKECWVPYLDDAVPVMQWVFRRDDHLDLRTYWFDMAKTMAIGGNNDNQYCGTCYHLGFKNGLGYCEWEHP